MDEKEVKEGVSMEPVSRSSLSPFGSVSYPLNDDPIKVQKLVNDSHSPSLLQPVVFDAAQNPSLINQKNGKVAESKPDAKEVKPGNPKTLSPPVMPPKEPAVSPAKPMPPPKRLAPPPPPPLGGAKTLPRNAPKSRLQRSVRLINLFRNLKKDVEGSGPEVNPASGRRAPAGTSTQIGGATGGREGLAASLAELTKRSSYFQQIEEDVRKHEKSIIELKTAIKSFQAKDMVKLLEFQRRVETFLERLTDETQVLSKFEDFPTKKLDALRTAAALYSKLDGIVKNLKGLEIVPPLDQLFNRVEAYFTQIKKDLEAIERVKDEESKIFKSNDIDFDFNILTRIKELTVDVSSSCMELTLKEMREAKVAKADVETGSKTGNQQNGNAQRLWRAFQLAYRVYGFAGGVDDRAEKLAVEVAHQITSRSLQQ